MKTVKIDENDWSKLQRQKLDLKLNRIADVIKENITFSERFNNEKEFTQWFKSNYNLLGFDKLIKWNNSKTPDFIMEKERDQIKVELETLSSHFFVHKHNPKDVDLVICIIDDKKLPVKTIEIGKFEYINPLDNIKTLKISEELHEYLKTQGGKGQTFEQIIWNLLGTRTITKEQQEEVLEYKRKWEEHLEKGAGGR